MQDSPIEFSQSIEIDAPYHKDYIFFKSSFTKACNTILNYPEAKQLTVSEGLDKNAIKNWLISLSNQYLRLYKNHVAPQSTGSHESKEYCYQPENNLLTQQNDLLHNTLKKAVETTNKYPVPDLELDFKLDIPR